MARRGDLEVDWRKQLKGLQLSPRRDRPLVQAIVGVFFAGMTAGCFIFARESQPQSEPKSSAQEFYDACRGAVAADLLAAKRRHFETHGDDAGRVPCDLSDELISFAEAHLDHAYPTFGQLVVSFRAARGWQHGVPVGVLTPPADAQTTTSFLDASAAEAFRQFHQAAATLRIVSRTRNLAMAAGQRRPKIRRPVQL